MICKLDKNSTCRRVGKTWVSYPVNRSFLYLRPLHALCKKSLEGGPPPSHCHLTFVVEISRTQVEISSTKAEKDRKAENNP